MSDSEVKEAANQPEPSEPNGSGDVHQRLAQIEALHQDLSTDVEKLKSTPQKKRDFWDKLGTLTPLITGVLISGLGLYFTYTNNRAQFKLQEVQTIERLIPHLAGDEKEKKLAIVAIKTLTNTELATSIAEMIPSEGTVDALKSIASTGTHKDKVLAKKALVTSLTTLADTATTDTNRADNLKAALHYQNQVNAKPADKLQTYLELGNISIKQGDLDTADDHYRDALKLVQDNDLIGTRDHLLILRQLSKIYRQEGKMSLARDFEQRAQKIATGLGVKYKEDESPVAGADVPSTSEPEATSDESPDSTGTPNADDTSMNNTVEGAESPDSQTEEPS